ncbi:5'-nucleotidase C-terminal domain-containing protein, partial [candidate division WOR-3 bacterium]|nr:5'-nucleotidase C-terminal domain-containing protein [candidate division WOR-3 bacterium]
GKREDVRNKETNLGDLIADVMRRMAKADIAFVNAGGIRASIDEGEITIEDVLTVLPFGGDLVTMKLNGSEILEILSHHANLEPGSGGFLQVSGITLEIKNKEITALGIGAKQIELDKLYTVATNDFLAAGGDGYTTFKNGRDYIDTGLVISDILIDFIKTIKEIDVKIDGRIKTD